MSSPSLGPRVATPKHMPRGAASLFAFMTRCLPISWGSDKYQDTSSARPSNQSPGRQGSAEATGRFPGPAGLEHTPRGGTEASPRTPPVYGFFPREDSRALSSLLSLSPASSSPDPTAGQDGERRCSCRGRASEVVQTGRGRGRARGVAGPSGTLGDSAAVEFRELGPRVTYGCPHMHVYTTHLCIYRREREGRDGGGGGG